MTQLFDMTGFSNAVKGFARSPTDELIQRQAEELKWLQFFYSEARHGMGPADSDIYSMIKEEYVESGGVLPEEYKDEE